MEWREFYDLEPWGFPVDDFRAGLSMSVTANAAGNSTKPSNFMLKPGEVEPEDIDMMARFKQVMTTAGVKE